MHLGELVGEPLGRGEDQKARRLEVEPFRQMGVYKKVAASGVRGGGHNILGVCLAYVTPELIALALFDHRTELPFSCPPKLTAGVGGLN